MCFKHTPEHTTKKKSSCVCSAPPDTVNFSFKSLSLDTHLHYFYPSLLWASSPSQNPLCLLPKFSLKDSVNPWPLILSCVHPYLVRMNLQKLWFVLESLLNLSVTALLLRQVPMLSAQGSSWGLPSSLAGSTTQGLN